MSEFIDWSKWLQTIYAELVELSSIMKEKKTPQEQKSLRRMYIHKCDEWIWVNEIMKRRISYGKQRAEQQIEIIVME